MGLSAHQKNGGHDEWLTPPEILRPLGTFPTVKAAREAITSREARHAA